MKLHLTKSLLAVLILASGLVYAENKEMINQTIEGSGSNQKYLTRVNNTQEWSGNSSETVNYSNNTIKYTASGMSNSHAVLSLHADNYNAAGAPSNLTISGYGDVSFDLNKVSGANTQGAAIHMEAGTSSTHSTGMLSVKGNGNVSFDSNESTATSDKAYGGAMYLTHNTSASITGNNKVSFQGNKLTGKTYAYGGAIYATSTSTYKKPSHVSLSGNQDISFSNNVSNCTDRSYSQGGAIYMTGDTTLDINGNTGKVEFVNNGVKAAGSYVYGGAIYSDKAGRADFDKYISIQGNKDVVFQGNYEINTKADTYRLRSIYSKSEVKLSANEGGKIEFKDSIYVEKGLSLNEKYDGKDQTGTIIFSGKTTEGDLNKLIAANTAEGETARLATKEEIDASRTSVVKGAITLNAGTLSLQDGAILQATKVIIAAGATLEITTTSRVESEVMFLFGDASTDSLIETTLDADLYMKENSVLKLSDTTFNMNGKDLIIEDNVTFLCEDISAEGGAITLFGNVGSVTNSKGEAVEEITVNGFTVSVNNENGNVVVVVPSSVPEPTTATLSLLALCGLAMRRRRK